MPRLIAVVMSDAFKGIDVLLPETEGVRLSVEEINAVITEAGAEAGMVGIMQGKSNVKTP